MAGAQQALLSRRSALRALLLTCALATCGAAAAIGPADPTDWPRLSPAQREALAPLQQDWAGFHAERRHKWLNIAERYSAMSPDQKAIFHRRMVEWVRMTPEQRAAARENYLAAGNATIESRKQAWASYQKLPPEKRHELAREAKAPPKSLGHVAQYGTTRRRRPAPHASVPRPSAPGASAAPKPASAPSSPQN